MILKDYGKARNFCAIYVALIAVAFLMIIDITSASIYFHWYLKKDITIITNINTVTETVIC